MKNRRQLIQAIIILLGNVVTLSLIPVWLENIEIQSFAAAIGVCLAFLASELVYWWLFIKVFSYMPVWLYPAFTLFMASGIFVLFCHLVPGVMIDSISYGLLITGILAFTNAILASLLSLDIESSFDRNVIQKMVERMGKAVKTDTPGFLFLEIDGLSENIFRRALLEDHMPALRRWLDQGTHRLVSWETGFPSQTCSMQSGILFGSHEEIPAYRWWDRQKQRVVMGGNPWDAAETEAHHINGRSLLSNGGASRGNMFSGDANECMLTVSTMLDTSRNRGPGFYLYLTSVYVIARLITRFLTGLLKEWWQSLRQRLRRDRYRVSARNFLYGFLRAAVGPLLQDITTNIVIGDVLRGLPAIYAVYGEYDDLSHFAGKETPEAFAVLEEIDRYFSRIERAIHQATRPYHIIVLSDHGQSSGPTFEAAHGISLEKLVRGAIQADSQVFASLNSDEIWNRINTFLNESTRNDTKATRLLHSLLHNQTRNGLFVLEPGKKPRRARQTQMKIEEARVVVVASGCTGMVYFTGYDQRLTYEEIQELAPNLTFGLVQHPGIGFVLVRSSEYGDLVLGKMGVHFLDDHTTEGVDPLKVYSPYAAVSLKQVSNYASCADLIVNTTYDVKTEELCGFENQVSHHGGLGGQQNFPFLFYPAELPTNHEPLLGAAAVNRLLKGWRDTCQMSPN